jgi:hypothetical protein
LSLFAANRPIFAKADFLIFPPDAQRKKPQKPFFIQIPRLISVQNFVKDAIFGQRFV